jgi:hypothetical protein
VADDSDTAEDWLALTRALAAAGVAFALAAVAQPAQGQINLQYACSPPSPPAAANCGGWHTYPVTLFWDWDQTLADPISPGSCGKQVIAADTAGTNVTCEVQGTGESERSTVTVKVDTTPPTILAPTPSRPPDYGGWWNSPLDFKFSGRDATSGIAACDKVPYAGPDSAVAQMIGGCRDVAGNAATIAVPLKYDATPPSVADAEADPKNARVRVRWVPSPDVVRTEVTRVAGRVGLPLTLSLGGTTSSFTDTGLVNGVTYNYTIRVFDSAGNSSVATTAGVPRAPVFPLLRWRRVRGADYYNVQLFRDGRKILSAWPRHARLQLKPSWTFRGHRYHLTGARYRWYVWPGYGSRGNERYGRMIRTATFRFTP